MASTHDRQENAQIRVSRDGTPRLGWASTPTTVERIALPFQVVETINESRPTREMLRDSLFALNRPEPKTGWHNKLIWGDNKLVMGSLGTEYAGRFRLIYTDPPFDTGDDFSYKVQVGDAAVTKRTLASRRPATRSSTGRLRVALALSRFCAAGPPPAISRKVQPARCHACSRSTSSITMRALERQPKRSPA